MLFRRRRHDQDGYDGSLEMIKTGSDLLIGAIGTLNKTEEEVRYQVRSCRQVWKKHVVDCLLPVPDPIGRGRKNSRLFRESWDLNGKLSDNELHAIMAPLARAGWILFRTLFLDPPNRELRDIGERLLEASQASDLVLTFMADRFFVPWPMIYTHPVPNEALDQKGTNYRPEGFWGIRHVLEHKPERVRTPEVLPADLSGRVPTGVGYGSRIEAELIDGHRHFIKAIATVLYTERLSREALADALRSPDFGDRFLYFFCHGVGEGDMNAPNIGEAGITLADGNLITAYDLGDWLEGRNLPNEPLVFINACQGGHLTTIFYDTLSRRLLEKNAIALLGAQIDLPARFATEYARRLITTFLTPLPALSEPSDPPRLGDLVRTLAQQFLKDHRNPLGIAYTLYHGIDCYVEWGALGTNP